MCSVRVCFVIFVLSALPTQESGKLEFIAHD